MKHNNLNRLDKKNKKLYKEYHSGNEYFLNTSNEKLNEFDPILDKSLSSNRVEFGSDFINKTPKIKKIEKK